MGCLGHLIYILHVDVELAVFRFAYKVIGLYILLKVGEWIRLAHIHLRHILEIVYALRSEMQVAIHRHVLIGLLRFLLEFLLNHYLRPGLYQQIEVAIYLLSNTV